MVSCSSCCLSAAWSPESLSSEELLEDPTMPSTLSLSLSLSNSGFESEASGMFVCFSCTIEVKILLPIWAFTTLTLSSFFPQRKYSTASHKLHAFTTWTLCPIDSLRIYTHNTDRSRKRAMIVQQEDLCNTSYSGNWAMCWFNNLIF